MALYDLHNPYQRKDFTDYCDKLLIQGNEKSLVVEIKRRLPKRSTLQNNYLYLLLGFFASQTGYSTDEVKQDIFKKLCNPDIFYRERRNVKGETVRYLRSSADLDTGEMTLAIERFRNYSAAEAGIYLPAPNEESFLAYCEQQIELFKEYK